MGIFNFFIVLPEIVASLAFKPLMRAVFGEGSRIGPMYVVMLGGVCMLVASACMALGRDEGGAVPEEAMFEADEHEPLMIQESAQPVPSNALMDERQGS